MTCLACDGMDPLCRHCSERRDEPFDWELRWGDGVLAGANKVPARDVNSRLADIGEAVLRRAMSEGSASLTISIKQSQ